MMNSIESLKAHYGFTNGDVRNLVSLKPLMERHADEFIGEFYNYVKHFEDAGKYLKNEEIIKRHKEAIKKWFVNLFSGEYGRKYFDEIEKVGMAHVKINLPPHYVNAAIRFVHVFAQEIITKEIKSTEEAAYLSRSVDKIIDINLDVFTSSYIEEEKQFFLSQRLESYLIQLANRFTYGLNLILVLGLVLLGVLVLGLFVYDLAHVFTAAGDIEKGLLSTLGSLLMLWVVIELMDTEIAHLRGGKFAIKVFLSVALVAIIRKILVTSLHSEAMGAQITLIAAVAVLGFLYWLIAKVE
ncbi:heme-binding sensor globin domain-containing protein [bacterium]|nr:MAG: heme-binding sensor globin domain-containing protein [bacterium]